MSAVTVDHVLPRDEVIGAFGPELEPVLEIEPGATGRLETNDCFTGQIRAGIAQACKPASRFGTIARFSIPIDATPAPFST